jgi:hypothetical protein
MDHPLNPPSLTRPIVGWLLWLCLMLTFVSPASVLYHIFSHTIPILVSPHTPIRNIPLFIIYPVLFIPVALFSFLAGLKLWLVRPGAVTFAKYYLLTYLGAHIAYFLVYVFWRVIFQPNRPAAFVEMGWGQSLVRRWLRHSGISI